MNKKFYSASKYPIETLNLKRPTGSHDASNKPEDGSTMLWTSGEARRGKMETFWTRWTYSDWGEEHLKYRYLVEVGIDYSNILFLRTPKEYFFLPLKYFKVNEWPLYNVNEIEFDYPEQIGYQKKIRPDVYNLLARSRKTYVSIDWAAVGRDYSGAYVGDSLAWYQTHATMFYKMRAWTAETLVVWDNAAVKNIVNHEYDPTQDAYRSYRNYYG